MSTSGPKGLQRASRPPRGPNPLSRRSRRKLLAGLATAAAGGDVEAAEALVRLSLGQEEARRPAEPAAGSARERGGAR